MYSGENSIEFINQEGELLQMKSPSEIFFGKAFCLERGVDLPNDDI
jgi:hypothetical protein